MAQAILSLTGSRVGYLSQYSTVGLARLESLRSDFVGGKSRKLRSLTQRVINF
jgi:hypothetical protein